MTDKESELDRLEKRGVGFVTSVPDVWGGLTVSMTAEECREYLADEDAFAAKQHGVTKQQYLLWKASEHSVQCSARTSTGKRCKNFVVGGHNVGPKDWVRLQEGYCRLHGDE